MRRALDLRDLGTDASAETSARDLLRSLAVSGNGRVGRKVVKVEGKGRGRGRSRSKGKRGTKAKGKHRSTSSTSSKKKKKKEKKTSTKKKKTSKKKKKTKEGVGKAKGKSKGKGKGKGKSKSKPKAKSKGTVHKAHKANKLAQSTPLPEVDDEDVHVPVLSATLGSTGSASASLVSAAEYSHHTLPSDRERELFLRNFAGMFGGVEEEEAGAKSLRESRAAAQEAAMILSEAPEPQEREEDEDEDEEEVTEVKIQLYVDEVLFHVEQLLHRSPALGSLVSLVFEALNSDNFSTNDVARYLYDLLSRMQLDAASDAEEHEAMQDRLSRTEEEDVGSDVSSDLDTSARIVPLSTAGDEEEEEEDDEDEQSPTVEDLLEEEEVAFTQAVKQQMDEIFRTAQAAQGLTTQVIQQVQVLILESLMASVGDPRAPGLDKEELLKRDKLRPTTLASIGLEVETFLHEQLGFPVDLHLGSAVRRSIMRWANHSALNSAEEIATEVAAILRTEVKFASAVASCEDMIRNAADTLERMTDAPGAGDIDMDAVVQLQAQMRQDLIALYARRAEGLSRLWKASYEKAADVDLEHKEEQAKPKPKPNLLSPVHVVKDAVSSGHPSDDELASPFSFYDRDDQDDEFADSLSHLQPSPSSRASTSRRAGAYQVDEAPQSGSGGGSDDPLAFMDAEARRRALAQFEEEQAGDEFAYDFVFGNGDSSGPVDHAHPAFA